MLRKTGFTRFFGGKSSIKTRKSGFTRFFGGKKGIRNRKSGFSGSSKTRIPPLGAIEPRHPTVVPGSGIDANMSWTAFDGRTGNLYAIHEGTGPEEDVVSRWTMTSDLSNITREQESIGEQEGNGPIDLRRQGQ